MGRIRTGSNTGVSARRKVRLGARPSGRSQLIGVVVLVLLLLSATTLAVAPGNADGGAKTRTSAGTDAPTFAVTFTETGLPAGTTWTVAVDRSPMSSTGPTIVFEETSGAHPFSVATIPDYSLSPAGGTVTVAGQAVAVPITFTLITYAVTFKETGMPAAAGGGVAFNGGGRTPFNATGQITFSEPNGTYNYTATGGTGYGLQSSIPSSPLTVRGANVTVIVTFAELFGLTFRETGLPSGTNWSVNLTGTLQTSTSSTITFTVANGSYDYAVGTVRGYLSTPQTGMATVNGIEKTESIAFTPAYAVTFNEGGLPSETNWSVTLNRTTGNSTTTMIVFTGIVNGTYNFGVGSIVGYTSNPSSGVVTVHGANATEEISFAVPIITYTVTFTETGMPPGAGGGVNFAGAGLTAFGAGGVVSFPDVADGIYDYTISAGAGYRYLSSEPGSPVTVNGTNVEVTVAFSAIYSVTFSESGIPNALTWSVSLNGNGSGAIPGATTSTTFQIGNGTFSYAWGNTGGYHITTGSYTGSVTVNGANPTPVSVTFSQVMYVVTFTESNLSTGTEWSVTLNDAVQTSTGPSIAFAEPNGTYSYTVGAVPGWTTSSYSGLVTLNGTAAGVGVIWTQITYTVTFTESGLPPGTNWSVTLIRETESSTSSEIAFSEPNGTYPYAIRAVQGWATTSYSGSVTVNGTAAGVPIPWTQLRYAVTFTEAGLPSSESWSVTLNGATESSTGSVITFTEPNGIYPYTIAAVSGWTTVGYSGSVTVNGTATGVLVTWTQFTYNITFTETGLPSGTNWSVALNGAIETSTVSTIMFTEPNGTYPYSIGDISGWHQTTLPYTGPVTVSGSAVIQPTMQFTVASYSVTFAESGLRSGTEWYVNITGGRSFSSTAGTLTFAQPNGTYQFTVATGASYVVTSPSGNVTVAGAPVSESIAFTTAYGITFNRPSGAASGASWSVYLNTTTGSGTPGAAGASSQDIVRTTTASTLTILVPNGTYSFSIVVTGNPSLTTRGTVSVDGSAVVANPASTPSTFLGFSGLTGYYILIAVIAAGVVIGLLVVWMRRRRPGNP